MKRNKAIGHGQARGFALVAAMFIVVILALLGIMMVTIGGLERATATTALRGTQAYFAARAGTEWGIFGALNNTAATCGAGPSTPTTNTFNLAVLGLENYTVTVLCRYTEHRERNETYNVFVITSTASSGAHGSPDFVSRILRVTATSATPP